MLNEWRPVRIGLHFLTQLFGAFAFLETTVNLVRIGRHGCRPFQMRELDRSQTPFTSLSMGRSPWVTRFAPSNFPLDLSEIRTFYSLSSRGLFHVYHGALMPHACRSELPAICDSHCKREIFCNTCSKRGKINKIKIRKADVISNR